MTTAAPAARTSARFGDLVAAEWIKVWSLRSTPWVLGIGPLLVLTSAARASSSLDGPDAAADAVAAQTHGARPLMWLLLVFVAGCFGALTIVNEFGSGLIRTTLVAVPDRTRVVAAKAATVAGLLLAVGTVMVGGSLAITAAMLSSQDVDLSLTGTGAWQAFGACLVLLPVCGLIGMGIGALVRHPAATIAAIFVGLVLVPSAVTVASGTLGGLVPTGAWARLTAPPGTADGGGISVPGAWLVLGTWAAAATVVAAVVVRRRDV